MSLLLLPGPTVMSLLLLQEFLLLSGPPWPHDASPPGSPGTSFLVPSGPIQQCPSWSSGIVPSRSLLAPRCHPSCPVTTPLLLPPAPSWPRASPRLGVLPAAPPPSPSPDPKAPTGVPLAPSSPPILSPLPSPPEAASPFPAQRRPGGSRWTSSGFRLPGRDKTPWPPRHGGCGGI